MRSRKDPSPAVAVKKDPLVERFEQIEERLRQREQARRKRLRLTLLVGGVLALVSSIVFYNVSVQSRELTTANMVEMARNHLEPELPGVRATMEMHLEEQAPDVVRTGMQGLIDSLPSLRGHLSKSFNSRFNGVNEALETRLAVLVELTIRQSKIDLDRRYPDLSDRQKLEKLADESSEQLRLRIREAIDAMQPKYSSEVKRLQNDVEFLYQSDKTALTREEQIQGELLRTMVQLARRDLQGSFQPAVGAER